MRRRLGFSQLQYYVAQAPGCSLRMKLERAHLLGAGEPLAYAVADEELARPWDGKRWRANVRSMARRRGHADHD